MHPVLGQLEKYLCRKPRLGKYVYIARGAVVVGDVRIGNYSSVWYNAVLRADINRIAVGHHTNVQDNAVFHFEDETPCTVGNYVTVGHSALLHACRIGDESLIGMASVILDKVVVGRQCLIGAGALLTPGTKIPDGSLVLGAPAKVVRPLTGQERSQLKKSALKYVANAAFCLRHEINVSSPLLE